MLKRLSVVFLILLFLPFLPVSGYGQTPFELSDSDSDGVSGVIPPQKYPSLAIPKTLAPGKMLVDRSHGQTFDVSGFTDYLESKSWTVDEATALITLDLLSGYDVFLIPYTSIIFQISEIVAVRSYVQEGGGIWVFGEYEKDLSGSNSVASQFGVNFNYDMVYDPTDNEGWDVWPTIHLLEPHPITNGVSSFGYYAGCSLNVNNPEDVIGKGDDDAYASVYTSYPPVLSKVEYGNGRAVFSGDITPLNPSYYPSILRVEERLLLSNIVEWLEVSPLDGIVDNADIDQFRVVGSWGTAPPPAIRDLYGPDFRYHAGGGTGAKTATWDAEVPEGSGTYEIFV